MLGFLRRGYLPNSRGGYKAKTIDKRGKKIKPIYSDKNRPLAGTAFVVVAGDRNIPFNENLIGKTFYVSHFRKGRGIYAAATKEGSLKSGWSWTFIPWDKCQFD